MSTERRPRGPLRTLHVACMPFPTPQGTQAIVGMMLRALRAHGHDATLLTYAHGEPGDPGQPTLEPVRLADWPRVRSARSGPSLGKVALDLRMVAAVRAQLRRAPVDLVVAHNVEAAWVCAAESSTPGSSRAPWVYYAHTSMRAELPYYLPASARGAARVAGDVLDRGACVRSAAVFALTPTLAQRHANTHPLVSTVLPPFELPTTQPPSRADACAHLGLPADARVAVYAGNLDAYQGAEQLIEALHVASLPWHLLVATASDPAPLAALAAARGVGQRVSFAPLATEHDRATAHAAAELALVPRSAPGGLPIKLLDALARGVPVVAARRALAGVALGHAVTVVADDDPRALASGVERALHAPSAPSPMLPQRALAAAGFTAPVFAARFERDCRAALMRVSRRSAW